MLVRTDMPLTFSERRFEEFCKCRGIRFKRVPVGSTRTPDYDIYLSWRKVITEIKEITPNAQEKLADAQLLQGQPTVVSCTPGDRVRKKIKIANPQIKARARGRYPGLLVLFDAGLSVGHIDPYQIRVAMYGFENIFFTVPDDAREPAFRSDAKYGGKQKMTTKDNTSISAVAALTSPSDVLEMRVYHNAYASVPLPPKLFARYRVPQYRLAEFRDGEVAQWVEVCCSRQERGPDMRYVYATATCFALLVFYALIGGMLGWKHGGGAIPMLILIAALVGTWRAITKRGDGK